MSQKVLPLPAAAGGLLLCFPKVREGLNNKNLCKNIKICITEGNCSCSLAFVVAFGLLSGSSVLCWGDGRACLAQPAPVCCLVSVRCFWRLQRDCFPSNTCLELPSCSGACPGCQEEVTAFSYGSSAEQRVLWRKLLLCFSQVFFLSNRVKRKSLAHKYLCNRIYSSCYTMNAVICIDLFALHCEVFNVAA